MSIEKQKKIETSSNNTENENILNNKVEAFNPKPRSKEEFSHLYNGFVFKKNEALQNINRVRNSLDIPESDELPADIVLAENKLKKIAEVSGIDYSQFEQAEINSENSNETNKPLGIGDEVYKDGVFYKVHDFTPEYDKVDKRGIGDGYEPGSFKSFDEKEQRYVIKEELRVGDVADKLKKNANKSKRSFRAVIVEGGMGGGKGGFAHFTEDEVTRVTPELKEKIKKMQKESGRTEGVADHW